MRNGCGRIRYGSDVPKIVAQYRVRVLLLVFDLGCSFLLRWMSCVPGLFSPTSCPFSFFFYSPFLLLSLPFYSSSAHEKTNHDLIFTQPRPYRIRRTYIYALARPSLLSSTHRFTTRIAVCSQSLRAILPRALPSLSLYFNGQEREKRLPNDTTIRATKEHSSSGSATCHPRVGSRPWMGGWRLSFFGEPVSPAFLIWPYWDGLLRRRSFWTCACIGPSCGIA